MYSSGFFTRDLHCRILHRSPSRPCSHRHGHKQFQHYRSDLSAKRGLNDDLGLLRLSLRFRFCLLFSRLRIGFDRLFFYFCRFRLYFRHYGLYFGSQFYLFSWICLLIFRLRFFLRRLRFFSGFAFLAAGLVFFSAGLAAAVPASITSP